VHAVVLPIGDDLYAVPVEWVQQVVAAPSVTALVTAPSPVIGLFNLRGEIIPLLDTAALLGLGDLPRIGPVAFAVVLHGAGGPAALAATAVPERISLDRPASTSTLPGTNGTFHVQNRIIVLLDPAALMGSERLGSGDLGSSALTSAGA
jgi:purine-binding chemotaxis protein CheW